MKVSLYSCESWRTGFDAKRWVFSFYGLATLIGLSRIYLGVYFPGDVIVGACVGAGITCGMLFVFYPLRRKIFGEKQSLSSVNQTRNKEKAI